jgi:N-methylhydantoinase B
MYRAVEIDYGPPGSMVNASDPAPHVASTTCPAETITDAIRDTLSAAYPDRATAGWGHCSAVNLAGVDPRNEREYVHMMVSCLSCGAGAVGGLMDGWHAIGPQAGLGAANSGEMEVLEYHYPLMIQSHRLREDSGCPGEWRGGCGVTHEVEAVGHEMTTVIWGEGRKYPASSVLGAGDAVPEEHIGRVEVVRGDGSVEEMSTNRVVTLAPGERFITHSAGGGGIGSPAARDPQKVLEDVRESRVSVAAASGRYGVVLDPAGEAVDEAATAGLRAEMEGAR